MHAGTPGWCSPNGNAHAGVLARNWTHKPALISGDAPWLPNRALSGVLAGRAPPLLETVWPLQNNSYRLRFESRQPHR